MIYVDKIIKHHEPFLGDKRAGFKWCRMVADSNPELHDFAQQIGLKSNRYYEAEKPGKFSFYGLSETKRKLAIQKGAISLTNKELDQRFCIPTLERLTKEASWLMGTTKQAKFTYHQIKKLANIYDQSAVQIAQAAAAQMRCRIRIKRKERRIDFIGGN